MYGYAPPSRKKYPDSHPWLRLATQKNQVSLPFRVYIRLPDLGTILLHRAYMQRKIRTHCRIGGGNTQHIAAGA